MPRQVNTKEKILECAFGLYEKPRMSEISLSEIAAKAGISKTAIFRHYKNKEELMEKMREKFFEAFALMISQLDDSRKPYNLKGVEKAVRCVFDFCQNYPNYLSYFLQESLSDELLTEGVNMVLLDNGINVINEDVFKDKKNYVAQNMVPSFFQHTLLHFLILAYSSKNAFVKINDIEQYKSKVSELIYSGLEKKKNPISPERKKELDEHCKVQLESDEKSNRFFNAFVELLQNNRSSKITVEKIAEIADEYGLKVIYDAAHAFGVKYKNESVANFGDISMYSFHATKVFNTIEGGAACLKDPDRVRILNEMKNFGIKNEEEVTFIGGNAKMNEFSAAMGICNLMHIDEEISKRKAVYEHYIERLDGAKGIVLCKIPDYVKSNYSYFPIVLENYKYTRNELIHRLRLQGINARKYFYPLTNSFSCYKSFPNANIADTPIAQQIALRVLTLPLYADLSLEDVDRICDIILE